MFIHTPWAVCFLLFLTSRAWDKEKYLSHARVKTKKPSFSISLPRSKFTISLISIFKHYAFDIADPSSMQDACHMNFVTDLAHRLRHVLLNKSDYMNHYNKDSDWPIGTCSMRVYKMFREMRAPWSVRTSSLYFHKARALRHTNALLRYNARSLRHRYERAQFAIHIKEIKKLVPCALLSSIST